MGRRTNSKSYKKAKKVKSSSIEELLTPPTCYETSIESRYSPDSLKALRKELKDAINKLYSDYFLHFCKRKNSRIAIQNTLFLVYTEELVIEKNYCNELTQKVKQLVHLDSLNDIYSRFCKSLKSFMSKIYSQLQELKNSDPSVQLSCLVEAYFVVENSSKELSKVTSGIFDLKLNEVSCESVTKLSFLDNVLKKFTELIEGFSPSENPELHTIISNIDGDLRDLEKCVNCLEKRDKTVNNELLCPVPNYSVDEIVSYINGGTKENKKQTSRKRRVSKASTADSSESPFESINDIQVLLDDLHALAALDKEVQEFQCILENTLPLQQKLKPRLSEEWLTNLRIQIMNNNNYH